MILALAAGCAGPSGSSPAPDAATANGAVNGTAIDSGSASPEANRKARLPLKDIQPEPRFAAAEPDGAGEGAAAGTSRSADGAVAREWQRARRSFDEQRWSDAIDDAGRLILSDPSHLEAHKLTARAAIQLGNAELARKHLEDVLRRDPRDAEAHHWLGELAWQEQKAVAAIEHFRLALLAGQGRDDLPFLVLTHLTLAQALAMEGYLAAAAEQIEAYLATAEQPTESMQAYYELNQVLPLYRGKASAMLAAYRASLGEHEAAAAAYARAARDDPDDKTYPVARATELARAGRGEEAIAVARQFVAAGGNATDRLGVIEKICRLLKQPERFHQEAAALAEASGDSAFKLHVAGSLAAAGDSKGAARIIAAHLREHPEDHANRLELARQLARSSDRAAALHELGRLLDAKRESYVEVSAMLREFGAGEEREAWLAAAGGLLAEHDAGASEALDAAGAGSRDAGDGTIAAGAAHFIRGVLIDAGDTEADNATADFEAAADGSPPFAPALVMLARRRVGRDDWPAALELLDRAIEAGCADSTVYTLKGRAHEALDEMEAAEAALMEAFRRDTKNAEPLRILADGAEHRGDARRYEQLCRRIVEDVDPNDADTREKLIRLYINSDRLDAARAHFSDFERLGQTGAAVDRCKALLDYATSRTSRGARRLNTYRRALRRLVEKYDGDAPTRVDLALAYMADGSYESAVKELRQALAKAPGDQRALQILATAQTRLLEFEAAAQTARALLKRRPRDANYQQMMGELLLDLGDHDGSAEILEGLIRRDDQKAMQAINTARLLDVLLAGKRFDRAVEVARAWLDEKPDDSPRRRALLITLNRAERYDEAVAAAEAWLKEEPDSAALRAQYLDQLRQAKRYAEGMVRLLEWLADSPDDADMNRMLIQLFWAAQDWDSALEAATTAAEQPSQRDRFMALVGSTYVRARRFDEAIELYRGTADRGGSTAAELELISVLMLAERFTEAEKAINFRLADLQQRRDTGSDDDPMLAMILRQRLAQVYQQTDRGAQAVQQLEQIFSEAPTEPGINNDLGYTYADMGIKLDQAERMIRRALVDQPRNPAYLDSLGWVFYKQGAFSRSVTFIRHAIRLQEGDPDPILHDHLADALYRDGQIDEARRQWEHALTLRPADGDRPPNAEERRVMDRITAKLKQLDAGEPVDTAPLPPDEGDASQDASGGESQTSGQDAGEAATRPDSPASQPAAR